jgi:hypothetical protein
MCRSASHRAHGHTERGRVAGVPVRSSSNPGRSLERQAVETKAPRRGDRDDADGAPVSLAGVDDARAVRGGLDRLERALGICSLSDFRDGCPTESQFGRPYDGWLVL